ncbi:MAG: hypothetical protein SCK70_00035 [bacterium]|nr:hypothetical protein [bacterium]
MYYLDLPIYAQVIWIALALLVLLPWVAIPVIAIFKLIQVWRIPRLISTLNGEIEASYLSDKLGLTMADGGEKLEKNKK